MEVILLEKIPHLGNIGDIKKVKDGYARNYLLVQKKAEKLTPRALAQFNERRAEIERLAKDKLQDAVEISNRLKKLTLKFAQKASVDGRLFGSVTQLDLVEELARMGYKVHKSQISMPYGHIKMVGEFTVSVALHTDVEVELTVQVYRDSD